MWALGHAPGGLVTSLSQGHTLLNQISWCLCVCALTSCMEMAPMATLRTCLSSGAYWQRRDRRRRQVAARACESHEADVVVIGSGIGGLSCGALLAKAGKAVTVLESHDVAGGCAHSWVHPKVTIVFPRLCIGRGAIASLAGHSARCICSHAFHVRPSRIQHRSRFPPKFTLSPAYFHHTHSPALPCPVSDFMSHFSV